MAIRGAKPKHAALRLIEGKVKPRDEAKVRKAVERSKIRFGPLKCPTYLEPEAVKAWDRYIKPAIWLDRSREPIAIVFCHLWAEYQENPVGFTPAKHRQLRSYMSELGLTDERNRIGQPLADDDEDDLFS